MANALPWNKTKLFMVFVYIRLAIKVRSVLCVNSKIIADKRNHSIKTGSFAVRQGQHANANTVSSAIEQELRWCLCAKPARDEEPT